MDLVLNSTEVRVLGCLIEKGITTPDYYPLTLNSLATACNQKSNRDPVVSYDDRTVVKAIEGLRERKLLWVKTVAGNRVPKYEHRAAEALSLDPSQLALLCILMLRGPQTLGELRTRTARMHDFTATEAVKEAMDELAAHDPGPLVMLLERQPGQKEPRYAHLLAGAPEVTVQTAAGPEREPAAQAVMEENARITNLEVDVAALRQEISELKAAFEEFIEQFE